MLNKKAIAAFAAGATLLSGLAFAAPSFAAGENNAPKKEECTPATNAELLAANTAIDNDNEAVLAAQKEVRSANDALHGANRTLNTLKRKMDTAKGKSDAAKTAYDNAKTAADNDKKAFVSAYLEKHADKTPTEAEQKYNSDQEEKDVITKEQIANRKKLAEALTKATTAYVGNGGTPDDVKGGALKDYNDAKSAYDTQNEGTADGQVAKAKADLEAAQQKLTEAQAQLKEDKAYLAKLQCKEVPATPTPTPKPVTPADVKAVVEFSLKYIKDAKSDAKTVAAVKAALAKLQAAKDKAAKAAAFKELAKLVEPLMKKTPAEDTAPALKSLFGSDVLYTNYKGLAADLVKRGITNIGAYDALLDKLEFGLKRFGWENIIKNFPEHTEHNLCDFLAGLRRHLTKAVKHYGHVEAAVKDMQDELNEDMKDAQARHDWDAVKVIDQKLGLAAGLRKVAHNNLTRAKALLNSADDHAKDFSCDTQAKDVRKAMDKEPNSPFKKSGQKNNAQKPEGQNGQKPNGGAAGRQLGKTGATVALVAVAASVLAGMGAALRKIRH